MYIYLMYLCMLLVSQFLWSNTIYISVQLFLKTLIYIRIYLPYLHRISTCYDVIKRFGFLLLKFRSCSWIGLVKQRQSRATAKIK